MNRATVCLTFFYLFIYFYDACYLTLHHSAHDFCHYRMLSYLILFKLSLVQKKNIWKKRHFFLSNEKKEIRTIKTHISIVPGVIITSGSVYHDESNSFVFRHICLLSPPSVSFPRLSWLIFITAVKFPFDFFLLFRCICTCVCVAFGFWMNLFTERHIFNLMLLLADI